MGGTVLPPCCLTWDQNMMEVVKIMATSFKSSGPHTVALSAPEPTAGHGRSTHFSGDSWILKVSLGQSLLGSLLFFSGSWCTQGFVCALQESVSWVLCKFHNQIPLSSKFELPGGSQSLCQIPRFGNLLWVLKLSFLSFFFFFITFLTVWYFLWFNSFAVCG